LTPEPPEFDDDAMADHEAAESLIGSIKPYLGQRCCVFLDAEVTDDTCHGKLLAFIKDWPALMIRDLSPGKERLQRKRLVPLEVIQDMCFSPGVEKCKLCEVMKDLKSHKDDKETGDAGADVPDA